MSLMSILHIGQSGAAASQAAVRVTGDNVANASTPGYRRREVALGSQLGSRHGGIAYGGGVKIEGQLRLANDLLTSRVRIAGSDASQANVRSEILARANTVMGELGEGAISGSLDALLVSFDALAASPQSITSRNQVLDAASKFASDMNRAATELGRLGADIDQQMGNDVHRLNGILDELGAISNRLPQQDPIDLDRRDQLLAEIGEIVDVNVVLDGHGRPQVFLGGAGVALISDGHVTPLGTMTAPNGDTRLTVQTSSGALDVTNNIGGRLGGLVQARDVDLASLETGLDNFAFDVATAINTLHSGGYGTDGVTNRALFTLPNTAANASQRIAVDPTVAGNPAAIAAATDPLLVPGDNTNALALSQLRETPLNGGLRAQDTLADVMTTFGSRVYDAGRATASATETHERLAAMEDQLTGVSIDEEMTRLMQFQHSYTAAARVIQTADQLLGELINLKR